MKQIKRAKIHNGNCFDVFEDLSDDSVNFIATDPPYFIDGMGDDWSHEELQKKQSKAGAVGGLPVGMKFDPEQGERLQKFFSAVSDEAFRVLKPGGFLVSFSMPRLYHRLGVAVEESGFEVRDMLVWEHEGGQGKAFTHDHFVKRKDISDKRKKQIIESMRGRKTPQLRPKFEALILAQKPKDGTFVNNWIDWKTGLVKIDFEDEPQQSTVFKYKKDSKHKEINHMTVKPVKLMERLIRIFTIENQTVLDPFMGSGTTGVAALRAGRRFIGFEIEKKYFEIAINRLQNYEETG